MSTPTIDPSISRPDIVVLAGDINTASNAVPWAATTFPGLPVLYVHGNHEDYGRNLEDTQAEIRKACEATENVHFLDCDEYILEDVRFLGAPCGLISASSAMMRAPHQCAKQGR